MFTLWHNNTRALWQPCYNRCDVYSGFIKEFYFKNYVDGI